MHRHDENVVGLTDTEERGPQERSLGKVVRIPVFLADDPGRLGLGIGIRHSPEIHGAQSDPQVGGDDLERLPVA